MVYFISETIRKGLNKQDFEVYNQCPVDLEKL